ncbi:ABC transporter substrate-binding protein [Salisediminibacterium halotolerans]|uniref:ABC transporter substrate-binding protein n=1 Tax=Salisediminibacterium halotolerans TaxID=517425 RepID=UPI000F2BB2EA|nr:ABC transporter substrate-binding protein [Salisediminibacterium halotolerans]RLJ78248.1 carbohydrate ABC transporter substrate-binding protein (CUT1 family) [Actinophytocola xinjiangensis]RPE88413.1 carbohydrate ABC transporter substrate-binding protein (CUT1 family) [Salisediminibacterium halotolerans]TWG37225.1 carbohydrate ABC transporter substrate-binding protein (CUT1 family) [Salisediminibacterium halotolerans]GEL07159.1 ABC transporter substrate-binding protein [Salisediminibacterium
MKKSLYLLSALALTATLAACGDNVEENDTNADNEMNNTNNNDMNEENNDLDEEEDNHNEEAADDDGETVTLTYARGADDTPANELLIEAFEEEHPNIEIDMMDLPNDTGDQHDHYVTSLSAQDSEIDVFDADVIWPAEFAQADYVMELDRFIEQDDIDMDEYFPGTVEAGNFDGRQWAMPKFSDAGVLYYRTDILDEAPATWEELIEVAEESQGEADTSYSYLMQGDQYEGLVTNAIEFIAAYGGEVVDDENNVVIESDETIRGLEVMAEIYQADFVPNNINSFQEPETDNAFVEGESVMARNWPYMQSIVNDEEQSQVAGDVEIAALPEGDETAAATLGGWQTMINRYSEHPEEAWELVKFMTGEEGQKITAIEGGSPPTLEHLYEDDEVQEASELFADPEFVETLQNAVPRPVSPIYPELSDIMQIEISRAMAGDISPEEAAQNMQEDMEAAMED